MKKRNEKTVNARRLLQAALLQPDFAVLQESFEKVNSHPLALESDSHIE